MAFDYTNNLETAIQANADFSFTDRAGNASDTVKAANTAGEWCEENGTTTSSGTGPTANPAGRSGFIYTETSSPVASTVWAMKRDTSFDASEVAVTINIIWNLNAETASNVIVEYATVASPNETTDWSIKETVACTLTDSWVADSFDFSAQTTTTLWVRFRCDTDNNFTNDIAFSTWNEVGVDKAGIATVTPDEFDMDTASVTVAGLAFGATIGASDVYLSPNDLLSEAGEVDITSAVNTWSDTSINLDLTSLSAAELASLNTMGPGARFLIVNVGGVPATTEYFKAVTLHRVQAFRMAASANITASGEATTRQLAIPSTKIAGDFDAGRIQDDENPADSVDIGADGFTELEWSILAKDGAREVQYDFRVTKAGTVIDTYTVTPKLTISAGATLSADSASYTWTGTASNLEYHSLVSAEAGSYAWTGTAANLEYHSLVSAEAGSYAWTGTVASLELHSLLSAEAGSYSWSGTDANLEYSSILSAEAGSYSWAGQTANLEYHALLSAEAAAYTWAGQDATLTYVQSLTLNAEAGAYVWSGTAANLELHSVLTAEATSYAWTGQDATLLLSFVLDAEAASYAWAGTATSLIHDAILTAEATIYTWTGQDASLVANFSVAAETTGYSWTGQTATLIFDAMLSAEAGAYVWTGSDATLTYLAGNTLIADTASYLWSGTDAGFLYDRIMTADGVAYVWSGQPATLTYGTLAPAVTSGAFYAEPDRQLDKRLRELRREVVEVEDQITEHLVAKEHAKPAEKRKQPKFSIPAAERLNRHDTDILIAELKTLKAQIRSTESELKTAMQEEDDMEALLLL